MAPAKSAKDYTDDELKAMHGISLVSRNSNSAGLPKEGRWDDSDEDDDWGDTIDFGDGTKVTIGQTTNLDTTTSKDKRGGDAKPPRPAHLLPHSASPFAGQAGGGPWKRSEHSLPHNIPISSPDFPPVTAAPPSKIDVPSEPSLNINRHSTLEKSTYSARSHADELDHSSRTTLPTPRDESSLASGDARYQYDQNTYDRHWQNPPQTREIYNSSTGRFEQIDASQRQSRRLSHTDRKAVEIPQKIPVTSGDARLANGHAPLIVAKQEAKAAHIQAQVETVKPRMNDEVSSHLSNENNVPTTIQSVREPVEKDESTTLDPSSQEFIDMQKRLMAERREQAIQRRKDQEAEETARKDRARKKAAELAAQTEKEEKSREEAEASKIAKASVRPKIAIRPSNQNTASAVENDLQIQKATNAAIHSAETTSDQSIVEQRKHTTEAEMWQREVRITQSPMSTTTRSRNNSSSKFSRRDPFDLSALTSDDAPVNFETVATSQGKDLASPSQAAWGPIGSRKNRESARTDVSQTISATSLLSPTQTTIVASRVSQPSWSAFDGITKSIKAAVPTQAETREYNVFDASDEMISPEKSRHSPSTPGQGQSRTSSRFFPSSTATGDNKAPNHIVPFVSPILPPRIDSVQSTLFESPETAPALNLPDAALSQDSAATNSSKRNYDAALWNPDDASAGHLRRGDNRSSRYVNRNWFDIQSRSVWEIKPLKEGQSPRVKIPHSEKSLDWSRKSRATPTENGAVSKLPDKQTPVISTAIPAIPVWNMPIVLDTTTKDSHVRDPLVPPQPSLKLPDVDGVELSEKPLNRKTSRLDHERTSKYYTTKPSLNEELDNMSPIRVKTTEAELNVPRKFGRRVDPSQNTAKSKNDIKRQPVNMSDAPGGTGFKRGFANRVRVPTTTADSSAKDFSKIDSAAVVENKSQAQNSHRNESSANGPVTIMQRAPPLDTETAKPYQDVSTGPQAKYLASYVQRPPQIPVYPPQRELMHSQQFSSHQQPVSNTAHMNQTPMLSRVAPPGLAAPIQSGHQDEALSMVGGSLTSTIPASASRGPPGIILP
ncbi:protein of unknown function [Taphrina deformans PYCC 5710]|uniref:Uncharacterized protein n=1 Tax=Taphrina deformans (strain PYCC 5710 / ATCC 11124 / CBS 356.35 / IMI 108563 / JCM 9778 / NBRC 8474) TaxID=1097556 RepID=R4X8R5_TAPDE|nr:protein of unknown function [Taphrina deformans PYCC 5710]|eukprot:CCG82033.1 protein of unknown function [Taphrina deformans PYCC 5710]